MINRIVAWWHTRKAAKKYAEFQRGYGFIMVRRLFEEEPLKEIERQVDAMDWLGEPFSDWQHGANTALRKLKELKL